MGFDAFAINRIDYRKKADFLKNKELEFVWRPSNNFANVNFFLFTQDTDIWVHVMDHHYCPPDEIDVGIWTQKQTSPNKEWPNAEGNPEMET